MGQEVGGWGLRGDGSGMGGDGAFMGRYLKEGTAPAVGTVPCACPCVPCDARTGARHCPYGRIPTPERGDGVREAGVNPAATTLRGRLLSLRLGMQREMATVFGQGQALSLRV